MPNSQSMTAEVAKKAVCYAVNLNESSCFVCAEDETHLAIWGSYEENFVAGLERLVKESAIHPLPVKLYDSAQKELRNCLVAVQFASQLDKLTNLLTNDVQSIESLKQLELMS